MACTTSMKTDIMRAVSKPQTCACISLLPSIRISALLCGPMHSIPFVLRASAQHAAHRRMNGNKTLPELLYEDGLDAEAEEADDELGEERVGQRRLELVAAAHLDFVLAVLPQLLHNRGHFYSVRE